MLITKFQVILVNDAHEASILFTTDQKSNAHLFINNFVKEKYQLSPYLKGLFEDDCVSIYQYNLIFPKNLKCKIMIVSFVDIPNSIDD
jgi:hypothetical protein